MQFWELPTTVIARSAATKQSNFPVIPGWSEGPDPESRDSGFDASHRPGMTEENIHSVIPGRAKREPGIAP